MYEYRGLISYDKPLPIEHDEKYVYVNEDIKEYLGYETPHYKYNQKRFTKEEFDEKKYKWGDIYHAKCEICGAVYQRYHIIRRVKYLDGTIKVVCRDCEDKELEDKFYFKNYVPNFVDGAYVTSIIFNNNEEVLEHIKSITKDDEIAAISDCGFIFCVFDSDSNNATNGKSWLCIGTTSLSRDCGLPQLESFYDDKEDK